MKAIKFPAANTLAARALYLMLKGHKITHLDFQSHSASYRLSANIHILRDDNWPVRDHWERKKTSDSERVAKYKRFYIEPEELQRLRVELGERLDKFIGAVEEFECRATTRK